MSPTSPSSPEPAKGRRGACVFARAKTNETTDNLRLSGGFPHSEIPGSKGALASPGLIAECHVLHRLLLPRHPPNALLALDPIQRRTGPRDAPLCSASAPPPHLAVQPRSEVIQFPAPWPGKAMGHWLVYLTWNKNRCRSRLAAPGSLPTRRDQRSLMFLSLHACQTIVRLDGSAPAGAQRSNRRTGGSRRTRTSDLTLIRRAL